MILVGRLGSGALSAGRIHDFATTDRVSLLSHSFTAPTPEQRVIQVTIAACQESIRHLVQGANEQTGAGT